MTLSWPSFLAAVIRAFMPPPASADVAVAQLVPLPAGAAAAAARPRRAASGREQQAAGNGGSSRHGVPCAHYSLPSTVPGTRDSRSQILARQVEIMTSQDKREVSSPWRPGI